MKDIYHDPEIMELDNCTVRIYRPILSEEEHKRRRKAIHDAAVNLLRQVERDSR